MKLTVTVERTENQDNISAAVLSGWLQGLNADAFANSMGIMRAQAMSISFETEDY